MEDYVSVQGTRALRFMVERIHQAQQNPSLRPIMQSHFREHDLVLYGYEQREQSECSISPHGKSREAQSQEQGHNRQVDSPR